MNTPETIDSLKVKSRSEAIVTESGGRICDWLPITEISQARELSAVVDRALVLNAMLQIYFGAPTQIIAKWIEGQSLEDALTPKEKTLLAKPTKSLTEQERTDLFWNIEALWAILWATGLVKEMAFDRGVGDIMASLSPNLQKNEDGSKFRLRMKLRPYAELYAMRDLAYRFHWWTRDAGLKGEDTGDVSADSVMERRKALEWMLDQQSDWDHIELGT